VDAEEDGIPGRLVDKQPDLRIPVAQKLSVLTEFLDLLEPGFDFVTLADAAVRVLGPPESA
jgi:hypothetical protein